MRFKGVEIWLMFYLHYIVNIYYNKTILYITKYIIFILSYKMFCF
jgi:hypothetical protein